MAENVKVPPLDAAPETVVGGTPTAAFGFDFPFWEASDIIVSIDDEVLDPSDYAVVGLFVQNGDPVEGGFGSGTVTLNDPVSNVTVTIDRFVVGARETVFSRSSPLPIPVLNSDINKVTARQQDIVRRQDRFVAESAGAGAAAGSTAGAAAGSAAATAVLGTKANLNGTSVSTIFARNAAFQLVSDQNAALQTISDKLGQSICVNDFDQGDGDVAMFDRAIAHAQDQGTAGCVVRGLNGTSYDLDGLVNVPTGPRVIFEMFGCRFFIGSTDETIFQLAAWGSEFHGGEFYALNPQVSGSVYINLNGEYTRAIGVRFDGDYTAVRMSGVNCRLINCLGDKGAGGGRRIVATGGDVTHMIHGCLFGAQTAPYPECGIYVDNSAALTVQFCSFIQQGKCIQVAPGTGQAVASLKLSTLFLDSAVAGVSFEPSGDGTIVRTKMTDVWMSSNSTFGFEAVAPTGTLIDGVELTNCEIQLNGNDGIRFAGPGAKNLRISGGSMAGNVGAAIALEDGCTGVIAYGFRAGPCDGISTPNAIGLFLDDDAEYEIFDCDVRGNTANVLGYDTPGPTQVLRNVRGVTQTARGTLTIPIGQVAVAFDPGLDVTIVSLTGLRIAWTSSLPASGIATIFVPSFTSTTYTVQTTGGLVAGADLLIGWEVDVTPIPSS